MHQKDLNFEQQRKLRDNALDLLEDKRAWLISVATEVAVRLARERGTVASPQVIEEMLKDQETAKRMKGIDRRFMGSVFRDPTVSQSQFGS